MSLNHLTKIFLIVPIALLINFFRFPLFIDSLSLSFGGIFIYFLLEISGLKYALIVTLLIALQEATIHESTLGATFLLLEVVGIWLIKNFSRQNIIISGWIYWTFFGFFFYLSMAITLAGLDRDTALVVALKEMVNSMINVSVGSLLSTVYIHYFGKERKVSYADLIFVFFVGASTIPMLFKTAYQADSEEEFLLSYAKRDMKIISESIRESTNHWLNMHIKAVDELANRLIIWGEEAVEQLRKETEAIRRSFEDFHACYIADKDAIALTFYPDVNPEGRYMVGTNFSYRDYYKEVKRTRRYYLTEVFVAKFALEPVVGIAVPAVKEGKFIGYAYCGLRLSKLKEVLDKFSLKEGVYITLVDKNGRVIISTMPGIKPLENFVRGDTLIEYKGLLIEIKDGENNRTLMLEKYTKSFFYTAEMLREDTKWIVIIEVSLMGYMKELFNRLSMNFSLIHIFTLIAFLMTKLLASASAKPIVEISKLITNLARNIERISKFNLPKSNIVELSSLAEAFETLARKVLTYTEELKKMAYFDSLTGLPNRVMLKHRLETAINKAKKNKTKVAVLFIDLDYFKTVNDTLGHEQGDLLLKQVANRLGSIFKESDTIARFGGDEFIAVIPNIKSKADVTHVAKRILKVFETPFDIDGEDIYLSASVGIALYPDDGTSPAELIKNADIAMYRAKEEGKNNFAFFTEDMVKKAVEVLNLKNKLHKALERGEFLLLYQPIYSLPEVKLEGMEALLRWNSPDEGLVSPAKFMHILEELGLIKEVGAWVLEESFKKSYTWGKEYGVFINVNVSPRQFADRNFVNTVLEISKKTQAINKNIVLEITETSLMKNPHESANILKKLKAKSFLIAIDDFGTGYSSLAYLKRLPVDMIKIDMVFVQNITSSKVDRSIVETIIGLSKSLNLKSLAEGVETREQLSLLKEMGCSLVQGYLLGKPLTEEDAERLIRKEKGL